MVWSSVLGPRTQRPWAAQPGQFERWISLSSHFWPQTPQLFGQTFNIGSGDVAQKPALAQLLQCSSWSWHCAPELQQKLRIEKSPS